MAVFLIPKYLDRVKKIPSVAMNSVETYVLLFTLFMCDLCVAWVIQNELLELVISLCELILVLLP